MLSIKDYESIVDRMLSSYVSEPLRTTIRKDNQMFGDLATALMEADWKHEKDSGEIISEKQDNWGYRVLQFKWTIGRFRRYLVTQFKYGINRCAGFDGRGNSKYKANDNNLFLEEFQQDILKSKVLKPKEKTSLIEKFIHFKSIDNINSSKESARNRINNGIDKLSKDYQIFKITKTKHC